MAAQESWGFPGSTRVDYAVYDTATKVVYVWFPDGVKWAYRSVSPATWKRFMNASSAGGFLHSVLERHPNGAA